MPRLRAVPGSAYLWAMKPEVHIRLGGLLLAALLWALGQSAATGQLMLVNPGLEAAPSEAFRMQGWAAWGEGATPDIQPGLWGVTLLPAEGRSYVGLIAREDGTREGIAQMLTQPLRAGQCYYMNVALARDPHYAGFNLPLRLRLLGRRGMNGTPRLLAVSPMIIHTHWQTYTLEFTPTADVDQLMLDGSWPAGVLVPYRGNILVDHLSGIGPCLRAGL